MAGNTKQPRFEHKISNQVLAWPLTFVFKPSSTCLLQWKFFREYDIKAEVKPFHEVAVTLHKGVQHLFA